MTELFTRMTLFDKIRSTNSEAAWVEYVSYYKGYIYALLRGMDISTNDCDDLLQVIFVKCWKYLPKFEYNPERCKFRSWLTIMVRNTVRDHLKSKTHKNRLLETELDLFTESLQSENFDSFVYWIESKNLSANYQSILKGIIERFNLNSLTHKGKKII